MAVSKNIQAPETIALIAKKAFPERTFLKFTELNGGFCNISYILEFADSFKAVLKISAKDKSCYQRNEMGLMKTEVEILKLIKDRLSVKTPEVFLYDDSRSICDGSYFVMEFIPGVDYWSLKSESKLSKEDINDIDVQIGKLCKEMMDITGSYFGIPGIPECRFDNLYNFVFYLLNNLLLDAEDKKINTTATGDEIRSLFERDKKFFEYTESPSLVHYDLWEGNIFLSDKKISGVIDWERALYGDPLMEDRFRLEKYTPAFFDGFGQSQFSFKEIRRLLWYDLILYLSMMIEGSFRGYEDDSIFNFASPIFNQSLDMLRESF